jgi:hypothetical protein
VKSFFIENASDYTEYKKRGSLMHVAPACVESGEGSDHFGSYVCSIFLHLCKRLFPGLEPMTSWSVGHKATALPLCQGSPSDYTEYAALFYFLVQTSISYFPFL